ncbi:hypothetical protein [Actinoplanes sp. RD1]|uniref:hypothetical protein n=1 Tax=Actinoplanes sp. RD1 TaxID=3064538 RepID=UPI00274143E4|nr:hypothetical protein [Actinoplanes sp. RD1]
MQQIRNDFAVRAFLLGALRRKETHLPTYGELARCFGGSNQGQQAVLDRLARQCEGRREPDLTVLVVNAQGHPGRFMGRLWHEDQRPEWQQELERVRAHPWANDDLQ